MARYVPTSITLRNFGSFRDEQTFVFPEAAGLYFMGGVNEVEPRLGSNGAGKSTIWKALSWVLWDKTPAGLRAGDVCHWEVEKGVMVAIEFADTEQPIVWTVTRKWGPNSWTLSHVAEMITGEEVVDLTKDKSNPVIDMLKLQYVTFLQSILMAQGQDMFLDLKHDRQAALFSEVMGLDYWLEASAKASKKASAQDDITRSLERELANAHGRLDGLQDFGHDVREFEERRKRRLADLEERYKRLADEVSQRKEEIQERKVDERRAFDAFTLSLEAVEDTTRDLPRWADEVSILEEDIRGISQQLDQEDELETFLKTHEHCPTCDQSISPATQRDKLAKLLRRVDTLTERRADFGRKLAAAQKALKKVQDEVQAAKDRHQANRDELTRAEHAVKEGQRAIDLAERDLDRMEEEAENIEQEANPYRARQNQVTEDRREQQRLIDDLQRRLDDSNSQYSLYSYWVRGFKELRLQLIAEALTELEVEVNSCVVELGLVGWELLFEVDRETKGGSIQRGFSVRVTSPHNTRAVPWEAWSGGEGQRLRLAANMGLANLIRSRTGADLPLEVWDEPSQGLSPQGVQDMLEAMEHRAIKEQRQIWIVDHTAHSFGGYAGGATIIKHKGGSVIEQY